AAERRPRLRVLAPLDDERRRSVRVPSQPEREARRDVGVQVALERHEPPEQLALERRKEPERRPPDPLPIERIVGVEQEVHVARTDFRVGEAQAELRERRQPLLGRAGERAPKEERYEEVLTLEHRHVEVVAIEGLEQETRGRERAAAEEKPGCLEP